MIIKSVKGGYDVYFENKIKGKPNDYVAEILQSGSTWLLIPVDGGYSIEILRYITKFMEMLVMGITIKEGEEVSYSET